MRLQVLVNNNTRIDKNLLGEPGLCFYIEDNNKKILFDCGYSDVFIKNAFKLQVDLLHVTDIVFSHAHNDHTAGIFYLKKLYQDFVDFNVKFNKPNIIANSEIFNPISQENVGHVGFPVEKEKLKEIFDINLTDNPVWITHKLCFLGNIKNDNADNISETSLSYVGDNGLVIITGCSHVGLENIIERAKKVTGINTIKTIIGGFHYINKKEIELKETIDYLKQQNIKEIYPCHCTDLGAKMILSKYFSVNEVCVGDLFEF